MKFKGRVLVHGLSTVEQHLIPVQLPISRLLSEIAAQHDSFNAALKEVQQRNSRKALRLLTCMMMKGALTY